MDVRFYTYKRRPLPRLSVVVTFGNNLPLVDVWFCTSSSRKAKKRDRHVLCVYFCMPHGEIDSIKEFDSLEQAAFAISEHIEQWFGNSVGSGYMLQMLKSAIRADPLGEYVTMSDVINHAITF